MRQTIIVSAISATAAAAAAVATSNISTRKIYRLLDHKADLLSVRGLRADVDALYAQQYLRHRPSV